jgi:hypothetical protein
MRKKVEKKPNMRKNAHESTWQGQKNAEKYRVKMRGRFEKDVEQIGGFCGIIGRFIHRRLGLVYLLIDLSRFLWWWCL